MLLALCLALCACGQQPGSSQIDPPVSNGQQTNDSHSSTDNTNNTQDTGNSTDQTEHPIYPAELMVELVVEWERVDTLLSQLDDLAKLLHTAIEEAGCPLDHVTVTISTAGGFTAEALVRGGIDAAVLPAVDIISYENKTSLLALSNEEIPVTAIAITQAGDDLSDDFNQLLFKALTTTETGRAFLSACCGTDAFSPPTEDSLQTVRDHLEELEKAEGGHS